MDQFGSLLSRSSWAAIHVVPVYVPPGQAQGNGPLTSWSCPVRPLGLLFRDFSVICCDASSQGLLDSPRRAGPCLTLWMCALGPGGSRRHWQPPGSYAVPAAGQGVAWRSNWRRESSAREAGHSPQPASSPRVRSLSLSLVPAFSPQPSLLPLPCRPPLCCDLPLTLFHLQVFASGPALSSDTFLCLKQGAGCRGSVPGRMGFSGAWASAKLWEMRGCAFPLKDTAQACSAAAPPPPPAPLPLTCMALGLGILTRGPWPLLTGRVLLFQDRSLRPEEIEGESRPLSHPGSRGKGDRWEERQRP